MSSNEGKLLHEFYCAALGINWFDAKILPFFNYEEEWLLLTNHRSTCSSWSFVLMRCCALTWVTKNLMRAISNVHAGRIWPMGTGSPSLAYNDALSPIPWSDVTGQFYCICCRPGSEEAGSKQLIMFFIVRGHDITKLVVTLDSNPAIQDRPVFRHTWAGLLSLVTSPACLTRRRLTINYHPNQEAPAIFNPPPVYRLFLQHSSQTSSSSLRHMLSW